VADHRRYRRLGSAQKRLLALFAYVGATATMAMHLIQGSAYLFGVLLFVIANLAFGASVVVYNAFLPEIAEPDERDRASSHRWAWVTSAAGCSWLRTSRCTPSTCSLGSGRDKPYASACFRLRYGGRCSP